MSDDHQQRPPPLPPSARPAGGGCAVARMAIAVSIMLLPAMRVLASGGVRTWFVHPFSQDTVMLFGAALVGNCAGGGRYSLVAMIIWAIMSEVALMTVLQREQADFAAKFG